MLAQMHICIFGIGRVNQNVFISNRTGKKVAGTAEPGSSQSALLARKKMKVSLCNVTHNSFRKSDDS